VKSERFIVTGLWLIAASLVLLVVYLGWRVKGTAAATPVPSIETVMATPTISPEVLAAQIPDFKQSSTTQFIQRNTTLNTIIPNRPREEAVEYTVEKGDSVFGIAKKFNIDPETVLWANEDQLNDSPDMLSPGMTLKIPPVNGVYYKWKENDTLESVAQQFKAKVEDIINWPGNKMDLTNPEVQVDEWVMVPDGEREFRSWIVPQIARGKAGVSKSVYGPGACEGSYDGAYGSGWFAWPSASHVLSGNDFWSGHLGIDIAAFVGDAVYASDNGVIVFAGWSTGGYGNMVMIDHGNGYQTVYGHMSSVAVSCGQSVYQGQYIGAAGSTGNSTGSHLHFEIRLYGQFINPWYVLP
jgi:murein DD-endopeptidase MepM/ murein hydrolase activator NlpD